MNRLVRIMTNWFFVQETSVKNSRKEREREARKREILVAAKAIFAKDGYHGATLDEIALRAEFSKASLYTYFRDKQDLFYAVLEDGLDRLLEKVKEIAYQDLQPLSKLELMIRGVIEYLEEDRDFFRVFNPERVRMTDMRNPHLNRRILPRIKAFIEVAALVVKEGTDQGKIKKVDPLEVANLLFGMTHSVVAQWLLEGAKDPLEERSKVILDILLNGIRLRKGRR